MRKIVAGGFVGGLLMATLASSDVGTLNRLIGEYGKRFVFETLEERTDDGFTVGIDGAFGVLQRPNLNLVNADTLHRDLYRVKISERDFDNMLRGRAEAQRALNEKIKASQDRIEEAQSRARAFGKTQSNQGEDLATPSNLGSRRGVPSSVTSSRSGDLRAGTGCDNSDYLRTTPPEYRWSNDNPLGSACHAAVARVRALENDPNYDCDPSIRRRWSEAVEYASRLGCNL